MIHNLVLPQKKVIIKKLKKKIGHNIYLYTHNFMDVYDSDRTYFYFNIFLYVSTKKNEIFIKVL